MATRPKLVRISEQMKEWSGLLEGELEDWPAITSRAMFGMKVFYRKGVVFAALPRTRAFNTAHSVAFKLYKRSSQVQKQLEADERIARPFREDGKWISLDLRDERDLTHALKWFDRAYRSCGKT